MIKKLASALLIALAIWFSAPAHADATSSGHLVAQDASAYDGTYLVQVGRVWRDVFWIDKDNEHYVSGRVEPLARALVSAQDGRLELVEAIEFEKSGGPVFAEFVGRIESDGVLRFWADVNYLVGKAAPHALTVEFPLSAEINAGKETHAEPDGFDAAYKAHVSLKKISGVAPQPAMPQGQGDKAVLEDGGSHETAPSAAASAPIPPQGSEVDAILVNCQMDYCTWVSVTDRSVLEKSESDIPFSILEISGRWGVSGPHDPDDGYPEEAASASITWSEYFDASVYCNVQFPAVHVDPSRDNDVRTLNVISPSGAEISSVILYFNVCHDLGQIPQQEVITDMGYLELERRTFKNSSQWKGLLGTSTSSQTDHGNGDIAAQQRADQEVVGAEIEIKNRAAVEGKWRLGADSDGKVATFESGDTSIEFSCFPNYNFLTFTFITRASIPDTDAPQVSFLFDGEPFPWQNSNHGGQTWAGTLEDPYGTGHGLHTLWFSFNGTKQNADWWTTLANKFMSSNSVTLNIQGVDYGPFSLKGSAGALRDIANLQACQ